MRALAVVAAAATVLGLGAPEAHPEQAVSFAEVASFAGSGSSIAGLRPADIAAAYGLTGGSGGVVGVVTAFDNPNLEADLAVARSQWGLPACTTANGCFRKVGQTGTSALPAADAEWGTETALDVQAVSAACPACSILVVEASSASGADLGAGVNTAVSLGAAAVSASWGTPETASAAAYGRAYFTHPGVPVVAASGDSGYRAAVMPASLPTVIAVGGTTLEGSAATSSARIARAGGAYAASDGEVTPSAALDADATLRAAASALTAARAASAAAARAVGAQRKRLRSASAAAHRAAARLKAALAHSKRGASAGELRRARRAAASTASAARAQERRLRALGRAAGVAATEVRLRSAVVDRARAAVDARRTAAGTPAPADTTAPAPAVGGAGASSPVTTASPAPTTAPTAAPSPTSGPAPTSAPVPTSSPSPTTTPSPAATAQPAASSSGWTETAWSGAGSACSARTAKPAWQTDGSCAGRSVADIAAVADPDTGLAVYDTYGTSAYTSTGWMVVGGTSLAAPLVAAMIVRSGHASDYSDPSALWAHPERFRDVTEGSNGSCSGSAVCTAGTGWDGPTGLGTPRSLASF